MTETNKAGRIESLDALRGVAALAVAVFSHYQHFGGDKSKYPYASSLPASWLYTHSWLAVDLFFVLSGIVLTYRYFEPLTRRLISGREFFVLRLSRLYPLHVATLLVCAAVEWPLLAEGKPTVVYEHNNDLYHFFLHLTYLHSGWFEQGWSYNMPSWSVCSEVFVYVLFYAFATRLPKGYGYAGLATMFVGMAVIMMKWSIPLFNYSMARAMVGFFAGSFLYFGMREAERAGKARALGLGALGGFAAIAALAAWIGYDRWITGEPLPHALIVFPLAIVASSMVPPLAKLFSLRPFTFLGDISYAVYLMHVPLQMVTLTIAQRSGIKLPITEPWFLFAYAAVLVVASAAAHYGFERPARSWLRDRLSPRKAPRAAAPAVVAAEPAAPAA